MPTPEESLQDLLIVSIELYKQAKFREAEASFVECVKQARSIHGSSAILAETLNGVSIAYFALSKFDSAFDALKEALSVIPPETDSSEWLTLKACLLNNQARLFAEFERVNEVEENLLAAIKLVEATHPVYAAELHGNLSRTYNVIPRWRHKVKNHAEAFDRLNAVGEQLEVYFDGMAGWRRPGAKWDKDGEASPESIKARSLMNNINHLYESESDAQEDYESIYVWMKSPSKWHRT